MVAGSLVLNGAIKANGANGGYYNNSQAAGAGGGIHIEVGSFSGMGSVEATGGSNSYSTSYPSGSGGRISVYTDEDLFTGAYHAYSGSSGAASGAGTAYLHNSSESYGHLYVDNNGRTANNGSTPIRSVGRHIITGVDEVEAGVWRIEVGGTPWRVTDPNYDWGIYGIDVDLDASEEASLHYTVISNTTNTITLQTTDDLSGVLGNELVGVHTLETLTVSGASSVTFGYDKLLINNLVDSFVEPGSSLTTGSGSDL